MAGFAKAVMRPRGGSGPVQRRLDSKRHGVPFADKAPDERGGISVGNSVPREMHCAPLHWPLAHTGKPVDEAQRKTYSIGAGFMYPLIEAARQAGVDIRPEHKMTALHRENGASGRVIGIEVDHRGTR